MCKGKTLRFFLYITNKNIIKFTIFRLSVFFFATFWLFVRVFKE